VSEVPISGCDCPVCSAARLTFEFDGAQEVSGEVLLREHLHPAQYKDWVRTRGFNVVVASPNPDETQVFRIDMSSGSGRRTIAQPSGLSRNGWLEVGGRLGQADPAAEALGLLLRIEARGPIAVMDACQDTTYRDVEMRRATNGDYGGQIQAVGPEARLLRKGKEVTV
jgi:hypothetical protein